MSSCISDNMDDCPTGEIILEFSYTHHMNSGDRFTSEVDTLDVYLYDDSDNFVKHHRVAQNMLDIGSRLHLDSLSDGSYTAVVWAKDTNSDYVCTNYTTRKENMLMHFDNSVTGVFHGIKTFTVLEGSAIEQISLIKNTSSVVIKLKDDDATATNPISVGDYTLSITASNGSYNYDNTPATGLPALDYIQQYSVLAHDTLQAQSKMLRLMPGDDSRLTIRDRSGMIIPIVDNNNNTIISPSLVDEIMKNPSINTQSDLDRHDRFELTYKIRRNASTREFVAILTNINNWSVSGGETGI